MMGIVPGKHMGPFLKPTYGTTTWLVTLWPVIHMHTQRRVLWSWLRDQRVQAAKELHVFTVC